MPAVLDRHIETKDLDALGHRYSAGERLLHSLAKVTEWTLLAHKIEE